MNWHIYRSYPYFFCNSVVAFDARFTQVTLTDDPNRPLNTAIWYPTSDKSDTTLIGDNPAFISTQVIRGWGGSIRYLPVVLYRMAIEEIGETKTGWRPNLRVVATSWPPPIIRYHSLSTSLQNKQQSGGKTRDVSRRDYLLSETCGSSLLTSTHIPLIGHSLGGWIVCKLAGAKMDRQTLWGELSHIPQPKNLWLAEELGLSKVQAKESNNKDLFRPKNSTCSQPWFRACSAFQSAA